MAEMAVRREEPVAAVRVRAGECIEAQEHGAIIDARVDVVLPVMIVQPRAQVRGQR